MSKIVHTDTAPAAIGPYSQAVISGSLVFTSGQIAINPASGEVEATELLRRQHTGVEALHRRNANILQKAGMKLSSARIHRANVRGAPAKQAIGKSARGRAHVDATKPRGIDTKAIQRRLQLQASAPNVLFPLGNFNGMRTLRHVV